MLMGVKNGNAVFQRVLDNALKDYRDFARPFVDNIIVTLGGATYDESLQNHGKHLRLMLQHLGERKLPVSADRGKIFVEQVQLAGDVVGYGVNKPIPAKSASLEKWDKPRTVPELRAFLGFANYYQEFIHLYAQLAAPLYSMPQLSKSEARKGSDHPLHWTLEQDTAFEDLKRELLKPLALFFRNPDKPLSSARTLAFLQWALFWNRQSKRGTVTLLRVGPASPPPHRESHGPPGQRMPMPLSAHSATGLATSVCSRSVSALTTSP